MRLTCSYSILDDGSIDLHTRDRTLRLDPGPEAELWLAIAELAQASLATQASVLNGATDGAISAALAAFARLGLVRVEDTFILTPWLDADAVPTLGKIHLEITHRCNFACRACYVGPKLRRTSDRTGEATTDEWATVIGVAADLGCRFATVTGGEPFVRPDALTILGALHNAGITIEVNTNASLITPAVAAALAPLRLRSVEVSLYGSGNANAERYTGNARSYSAPLRGIRALGDAGVPFSVKYFATGSSFERFSEARKELRALGIEPRLVGRFVHGDIYTGDASESRAVAVDLPRPLATQETDLPCYPSVNALAIEPDGSVRACPKLGIHFGNVFVDGLEAVWCRSAGLKRFRTFWPTVARERGYVRGARREHLCPATEILSTPDGLRDVRRQWEQFATET